MLSELESLQRHRRVVEERVHILKDLLRRVFKVDRIEADVLAPERKSFELVSHSSSPCCLQEKMFEVLVRSFNDLLELFFESTGFFVSILEVQIPESSVLVHQFFKRRGAQLESSLVHLHRPCHKPILILGCFGVLLDLVLQKLDTLSNFYKLQFDFLSQKSVGRDLRLGSFNDIPRHGLALL